MLVFFALLFPLALPAAEQYNKEFSFELRDVTVKDVFRYIEKNSEYVFLYASNKNLSKKVNVDVKNKNVKQILDEVLEHTGLVYEIDGKQIIVKEQRISTPTNSQQSTLQQAKKVYGVVKDESGETIIGANVWVKDTTTGVVTDIDGRYQINLNNSKATLVFSYLGMKTQEIVVGDKSEINVVLKADAEQLDEVVVVGYGVQKKVNLTGSVSSVNGEELSLRPVANATQSLQGLVPGLTITNVNTGRPGASATLTLRGQGNLANNANPYVLVDGVEMDLADVNPNDIESISVLKDASAAAIYGARAAYGVVLVTTKKGNDGKVNISYQGSVAWSSPTKLPEMVNGYDFATYFNQACRNAGVPEQYSPEKLALLKQYIQDPTGIDCWSDLNGQNNLVAAFENTALGVGNTDYFDLHYKNTAFKQNHNLSFSGGGKKVQYYISGAMYQEDGILRFADMKYKRFNFNANLTSQLTDWLKIKINTKFVNSDNDTPFGKGGLADGFYHSLARFRPTVSAIDPNGHYTELTMIPYLQSGTYTETKKNNLTLTGGLQITPLKNWHILFDYTYRQGIEDYEALNVAPMIPGADNKTYYKGTRVELGIDENGRFTRSTDLRQYQSINLYTNYLFSLQERHNFTIMGGYQEENYTKRYLYNSAVDLISTNNPGLGLSDGELTVTDERNGWATRGFFGRINYDYDGRYLLELNGRYDGSSRFASQNRWGFFPSISVGWNIVHENFMEKVTDILSILKLRGSYGLLGNQAGANLYTFASRMGIQPLGNYIFQNGRDKYIKAPNVIDPFTTWEKVKSANVALDFGFFNNALTGTLEVFQRNTEDMLGPSADFADFFGSAAPQSNNACLRNRGWEFSIQYKGRIGKDIKYTVGGSIADATAVVTEYENPSGTNPDKSWYAGKSVGEIWGYRASGLLQTQEEADAYNSTYDLSYLSGQKWKPGDVKYVDLNGDNRIDSGNGTLSDMGDKTVIGNMTPRYQYTINGDISWKGVTLNLLFQGVAKRDWAAEPNTGYFWGGEAYAQVVVFKEHLDYWTPDNPNAYYPNPYTAAAGVINQHINKVYQKSDRYLQNAAYCRLKNVTLSYDLPVSIIRKIGLNRAQVFFSGENLLTFTKLSTIFDPEAIFTQNSFNGTNSAGKNYPMNKVLSLGVIVNL